MQDPHVTDLIPAYALGALEPDEVDAVERHLAHCAVCSADVRAYGDIGSALLLAVPAHDAPPALRDRLMGRIATLSAEGARAAPQRDAQRSRNPIARALRAAFGPIDDFGVEADFALRNLLLDPGSVVYAVNGAEESATASARLVANPSRGQAIFLANGLKAPGAGKKYQIWFLRDGKPVPNALFDVDRRGRGVSLVHVGATVGAFDTVAVTPEPASGSISPTGPIVLAGALRSA